MAAIKLYGSPISTASQRAMVALHEKCLDFEFVTVDMKSGAHKQEPFISLNPFGQVPALEDGDLKIFDSRAIAKYVAETYADKGTALVPSNTKPKAVMYSWMEAEAHQFDPAASKLAWELHYKPMFGMSTDPAQVEEHETKLAKVLDVYEARLSVSKYLACDCFTLADMNHLPVLHCLSNIAAKKVLDARPHVAAWAADITARPAWVKVVSP